MKRGIGRLIALAACSAVYAAANAAPDDRDWPAVARRDLEEMRRLIEAAHPGVIDEENPAFRAWLEDGYRQAGMLATRSTSDIDARAAAAFYATGFRDPHLGVRDAPAGDAPVDVTGWFVRRAHGRVEVTGVVDDWPMPLPSKGALLVECDGRSPDEIVDRDIAPYIDRRPALHDQLLTRLGMLRPGFVAPLRSCTFEQRDGKRVAIPVAYRTTSLAKITPLLADGADRAQRAATVERMGDALWVRLPSFGLDGEQTEALRRMLKDAPRDAVRVVVFDVRGNDGGDSAIGDMAFEALTGGLVFDEARLADRPPTYALYRVSPVSLAKLDADAAMASKRFGVASAQAGEMRALAASAGRAAAAHESWVVQYDGDRRITRADVVAVGGRLRDFRGTIAVLTDERCVSACLDFVDKIRQVPGSLHLGRPTDGDTNYIDIARRPLPSGRTLILPVKVWRNRARASGERLIPDRAFDGDIGDDAQVRPWVLDALRTVRAD